MTCAQSKGSKSMKMRALGCLEIDTLALMYQVFSRIRRIEKDVTMMAIVVRRTKQKRICFFFKIYLYCTSYHKLQGKCAPLLITHLQGAAYMKAREYVVPIEM